MIDPKCQSALQHKTKKEYPTLHPHAQKLSYPANQKLKKISPLVLDLIRGVLTGHTVAMVTYCVTKIIRTSLPMIGQFFGTKIAVSRKLH